MTRRLFFLWILFFSLNVLSAQKVEWINVEDFSQKMEQEKRPLLIFFHADWCEYCHLFERYNLEDKSVAKVINEKFYAIKFNTEFDKEVSFLGETYSPNKRGRKYGTHQFAQKIGTYKGELRLPATVVISKEFNEKHLFLGFEPKDTFLEFLKQFF